jgi:hypothetical protein
MWNLQKLEIIEKLTGKMSMMSISPNLVYIRNNTFDISTIKMKQKAHRTRNFRHNILYTRKALMQSIKGRPSKKCSRCRWTSRYMMINCSMVHWFLPELYITYEWTNERHCSLFINLIGMLEIRILLVISLWSWLLIATDIHVYNHL